MDNKKIVFVVEADENYEMQIENLNNVNIPDGYNVDVACIGLGWNKAALYNEVIAKSDAQYKVFINGNNKINNLDFLSEMLEVFLSNKKIGMLGILGTKRFSIDTMKWKSESVCSSSGDGEITFGDCCEKVKLLDASVIATQKDVFWREDLFLDMNFLVKSHCIEMERAGYDVVVPRQKVDWFSCSAVNYDFSKEVFNRFSSEYAKEIYPLVSILIPTYNRTHYLEIALKSVLKQDYKNIEIIISDDGTTDETENFIQPYLKDTRIKYKHHQNFDFKKNWMWLIDNFNGEYFNFLMDDDMFSPNKISRMMDYYLLVDGLAMVTSYRQLIDKNGENLADMYSTTKISQKDVIIDGKIVVDKVMRTFANFLGEPTTVLLPREAKMTMRSFIKENSPLIDIKTWLSLLQKGNLAYISESLSYFRYHDGQDQKNRSMEGALYWIALAEEYHKKGIWRITNDEYRTQMSDCAIPWMLSIWNTVKANCQAKCNTLGK